MPAPHTGALRGSVATVSSVGRSGCPGPAFARTLSSQLTAVQKFPGHEATPQLCRFACRARHLRIRRTPAGGAGAGCRAWVPTSEVKAAVALRCEVAFARDEALRESAWGQVAELDRVIDQLDDTLSTMRIRGSLAVPADVVKPRRTRSSRRLDDSGSCPAGRFRTARSARSTPVRAGGRFSRPPS
jgi:hypothetical protein